MSPERVAPKVLSWASDIEPDTIAQATRVSQLPFVTPYVALQADAHFGIGATVGSVIPTINAIIPAAVGVDIGCGMIAVQTDLTASDLPDTLDPMIDVMDIRIPAGLNQGHQWDQAYRLEDYVPVEHLKPSGDIKRAIEQFGTLGSGNHFVEVCLDEADSVWCILHSGSRGIGNKLARRHIDNAKKLMKKWHIALEDPDLAYLVDKTEEFSAYIRDMLWAQDYAFHSRERMMDAALRTLFEHVGRGTEIDRINSHHNFTVKENHHGKNLWITRKGAVKAGVGDRGIIPGSMGTRSYIVEGLGNPASFNSCAHGAGRRMSRTKAKKTFTVEDFETQMANVPTWQRGKAAQLLDECPLSYKDVDQVMEDQKDLVKVLHTLRAVLNYKGAK